MNEQKINDLKNSLREIVQMISAREGPLPEDLKVMLVQVMEHVANRIQELRKEEQQPAEGLPPSQPIPELQQSMPSSNVHSFGYDEDNGKLLVKFQGDYPQENGPVYEYNGVSKLIFELFRKGSIPARTNGSNKWGKWWKGKVPSVGASLFTLIKNGGYSYNRLT
jgi:hypothetical protein